ncbi:ribokinase [Anaerotruncus colihominis]|uniref:ribokinase n=1 Tax=Anaerotruncus colihominis TaxID=169435 RepID=UPI0035162C5C
MKVLNFGSLNYDYTYSLDHIVAPGETITSTKLEVFPGGKGLNQSISLARAGAQVCHAGMVGPDGGMLIDTCEQNGVDHQFVKTVEERTGNAIIQVSAKGQNSIVLFAGANRQNDRAFVDEVLSHFGEGDLLLLQNEINLVDYLIDRGFEKGMVIALNPSPFDDEMRKCDLSKVTIFLMNEVEGEQITGEKEPEKILTAFRKQYPQSRVVLTLGKAGVVYQDAQQTFRHGIYKVPVVDTTAAGDTFTGYFLAGVLADLPMNETLRLASIASSIAVSKKGATSSIPYRADVLDANLEQE